MLKSYDSYLRDITMLEKETGFASKYVFFTSRIPYSYCHVWQDPFEIDYNVARCVTKDGLYTVSTKGAYG
jgi:hypothetical protein